MYLVIPWSKCSVNMSIAARPMRTTASVIRTTDFIYGLAGPRATMGPVASGSSVASGVDCSYQRERAHNAHVEGTARRRSKEEDDVGLRAVTATLPAQTAAPTGASTCAQRTRRCVMLAIESRLISKPQSSSTMAPATLWCWLRGPRGPRQLLRAKKPRGGPTTKTTYERLLKVYVHESEVEVTRDTSRSTRQKS